MRVCQFHHFGNALWYPARTLRIRQQPLVSQTAAPKSNPLQSNQGEGQGSAASHASTASCRPIRLSE